MSRTTPRRMPALRSTPRPRIRQPASRGSPVTSAMSATTLVEPRSSAATSRCGCALMPAPSRTITWPANRPSSSLVRASLPGEVLLHRRHRSNVLRRKPGAEPEPAVRRPRTPRRDRPATPRRSARTARDRTPWPAPARRDQRAAADEHRQIRRGAERIERQHLGALGPPSRAGRPWASSATGYRLGQLDAQRARRPAAHARRRGRPAAGASRAAIGVVIVEDAGARRDAERQRSRVAASRYCNPTISTRRTRKKSRCRRPNGSSEPDAAARAATAPTSHATPLQAALSHRTSSGRDAGDVAGAEREHDVTGPSASCTRRPTSRSHRPRSARRRRPARPHPPPAARSRRASAARARRRSR